MTSPKWILRKGTARSALLGLQRVISLSESRAFLEILVRMAKGDWDGKSQLEIARQQVTLILRRFFGMVEFLA